MGFLIIIAVAAAAFVAGRVFGGWAVLGTLVVGVGVDIAIGTTRGFHTAPGEANIWPVYVVPVPICMLVTALGALSRDPNRR